MGLVKNRQGYLIGNLERECTRCGTFYKITNAMSICPSCNCDRVKNTPPESRMLNRASTRARKGGFECTITTDDIVIPETCPILGTPLIHHSGSPGGKPNSPSLDRIDNELGYVPGNVRVISHLANMMKSCANEEQLVRFAEWVIDEYKPKLKREKVKRLSST